MFHSLRTHWQWTLHNLFKPILTKLQHCILLNCKQGWINHERLIKINLSQTIILFLFFLHPLLVILPVLVHSGSWMTKDELKSHFCTTFVCPTDRKQEAVVQFQNSNNQPQCFSLFLPLRDSWPKPVHHLYVMNRSTLLPSGASYQSETSHLHIQMHIQRLITTASARRDRTTALHPLASGGDSIQRDSQKTVPWSKTATIRTFQRPDERELMRELCSVLKRIERRLACRVCLCLLLWPTVLECWPRALGSSQL